MGSTEMDKHLFIVLGITGEREIPNIFYQVHRTFTPNRRIEDRKIHTLVSAVGPVSR